jgi:hypothetical protein
LNWFVVATAATTTARVLAAIKLKKILVWGQPSALGAAAATVGVEWKGLHSNNTLHSDTSSGIQPAFVSTTPPKGGDPSFWWDSASTDTVLFALTAPVGATIDIIAQVRLFDNESAAVSGPGTTGATLGKFYGTSVNGLGTAAGGTVATPVGLNILP